jgi:hypothetical protein
MISLILQALAVALIVPAGMAAVGWVAMWIMRRNWRNDQAGSI